MISAKKLSVQSIKKNYIKNPFAISNLHMAYECLIYEL